MKSNIALIGFMGAGKTSIARELARRLGRTLVHLDRLVEERAEKTIAQIFAEDGEILFRELEIEVVAVVARLKNQVIDCGGGIVLNQINIARLHQDAVIVYLTASPGVLHKRIGEQIGTRPLIGTERLSERIAKLLQFRRPLYEAAADITIGTERLPICTVVDEIIAHPAVNGKNTGWNF
jgi:shikimate kinase